MLMGQSDEAVAVARQATSDAESAGDAALSVIFPLFSPLIPRPARQLYACSCRNAREKLLPISRR